MIKKIRRFGISALLFSAVSSLYFVSRKGLPPPSASPESRFDFRYYDDDGGGANPAGERSRNQAALLSAASDSREPGLRKLSEQEELINALERDIRGQKDSLKEYAQLVRSLQDEIAKRGADRAGKTSSSPPLAATGAGNGTADGPLASKGERVGPGAGKRPDASTRPSENKHDRLDALLAANYMGCYPDSFNNRDLPEFFPAFTTSPAKCIATCRSHGHNFAGLQDGGECWCGSELPRRTKLPDSQCQKRCSGDPLKFCGGTLKNSVYKADLEEFDDVNINVLDARPFDIQTAGSSVICQGHNFDTRVCKFRNLYYDTSASLKGHRIFIFYRGPGTIIKNMDNIKNVKSGEAVTNLLEFTSISGVYAMDLVVVDVPPPGAPVTEDQQKYMEYKGVHVLRGASFLFARFLPFNIMHHIHDDLMNLFMTMVEYTDPFYEVVSTVAERNGKDGSGTGPAALFNLQSRLVIVDAHGAGGYAVMTQYLSDLPVTHITEIVSSSQALAKQIARSKDEPLPPASDGNLVRFESAVVGITRHCNWYQYGFRIPQGPIEGKEVDGFNVRLFTNHILARIPPLRRLPASVPLRLEGGGSEAAPTAPPPKPEEGELVLDPIQRYIVIFSRTLNRNILNEPELANALRDQFPFLKVVIIRLEETPIPTIIRVLERTRVAVGMHGSILILAMFMPKDSLLVELFPYAVPAENYTPYKTMANLKGMGIKYAAWMNSHLENNVGYPDRHRLHGGISHLPENEQQEIKNSRWVPTHTCCENPYWLFRIYQDTKVHIPELMEIIAAHRT